MTHIDDTVTQRSNATYVRATMNAPMLEKTHELNLARRWREHGDEKALHELVTSYTRLVVAIAGKFRNYGLPLGDLIQEGNIGLMQAASRFEADRDLRFSTYAMWWIRSTIQDYILRNWSIVRTGTTSAQKSLFFNLRRLRAKIEGKNGQRGLTDKDRDKIANDLGVNVRDVRDMETRLSAGDQSLNLPVGEDGDMELMGLLADDRPNPEEIVMGYKDSKTRSAWLNKALDTLTDRERQIVRERHLSYDPVTLEDLGKELGISKERVRQLEARAMDKLKVNLSRQGVDGSALFAA
jgi:RNA polymerase sigma-32 factor